MDDKAKMSIYIDGYRDFKKMINDYESGLSYYSEEKLNTLRRMIARLESPLDYMDERDRFIIYNELVLGKKGKWYLSYYSPSAYRVRRKEAYRIYLHLLELK